MKLQDFYSQKLKQKQWKYQSLSLEIHTIGQVENFSNPLSSGTSVFTKDPF